MKFAVLVLLLLSGCAQVALKCPGTGGTVSYMGSNIMSVSPTVVSCVDTGSGPMASVSGVDIVALTQAVMTQMTAQGKVK